MTAKQRVVLAALRDAQHERDGDAVSAGRVADVCPAPRHGRADLVTAALVLLERHGLVLVAAGSTRAWKITAAGRLNRTATSKFYRRRDNVVRRPLV